MRYFFIFSILFSYLNSAVGQTEVNYPKTLWSDNDSFSVRFSNAPFRSSFQISKRDTTDAGTGGAFNQKAIIYYGKDSLVIPYKNIPWWKIYYIPFKSPKGKTIYRLHFNGSISPFTPDYIKENNGKVRMEIPEVYELANIIWTLSPTGERANNLNKEGAYYERVINYFKPFLNHSIFRKLDFPDSEYFKKYYDFRENSFCFNLKRNKIVYNGLYYYVMGNDDDYNSLFKELIPLIQDFAKKSHFKKFYSGNESYYRSQILREQQLMPAMEMWQWLEKEFPKVKYNSYRIVFSPLIKSSHSTQKFSTYQQGWFTETVMFVSGPEIYDGKTELTEKQKLGLLSGILFTEIDHNYVNPTSFKYSKQIDSIFSKRNAWVKPDGDTQLYDTPMSVFNEYMTHSLFCLYVLDNFDAETAGYIINKRESLMVDTRHYIKFKEFNQALTKIRRENPGSTVSEFFNKILDWCKQQI